MRPRRQETLDDRLASLLSPDLYLVLNLRIVRGLTVSDTARLLRLTPAAVRLRQHRALATLRRAIASTETDHR